jgi:outer membrane protein TolC
LELEDLGEDWHDELNRLAAREQGTPVELAADILEMDTPGPPTETELLGDLKARNPEWLGASADVQAAEASLRSAKMDRYPDFRAGMGVSKMGPMPPAWKAEVGVALPIWSGRKQGRAVAAARSALGGAESVRAGLALALAAKSRERVRAWRLAFDTAKAYRDELIPQGEAALGMLMARFQNGGASFVSVVEALNAVLADHERRLDAIAEAHRLAVRQHAAEIRGQGAGNRGH